jgi:hypothetical protein
VRPTKYLAKWSKRDRGLAEGLLAYEGDLNRFGYPSHIARDASRRFAPDEGLDYAVAAAETFERDMRKAKNDPPPGFLLFVKDMGPKPQG